MVVSKLFLVIVSSRVSFRCLLAQILILAILLAGCSSVASQGSSSPADILGPLTQGLDVHLDDGGAFANYSKVSGGTIDQSNGFFRDFGTNGRRCSTCHVRENGFSITTDRIKVLFDRSQGTDELFAFDGKNRPDANTSTLEARRAASSLLLNRGVFRIDLGPVPNRVGADYELVSVSDPYGMASAAHVFVYRRPLMATNLMVGTAIMWDGREPNLQSQANNATLDHAQSAQPLTVAMQDEIVAFEKAMFTTRIFGDRVGEELSAGGSPVDFANRRFFVNQNANMIPAPAALPLTDTAFTLFRSWTASGNPDRRQVLRGQQIFNRRELVVSAPPGIPPHLTCSTCHSALNDGSNDMALANGGNFLNTNVGGGGLSFLVDPERIATMIAPDLPGYTFRNKATGQIMKTTDPGHGHVTGKFRDLGRFKIPTLRGVSTHPPFFHNGQAKTLKDVVLHYRFILTDQLSPAHGDPLTDQEIDDLVAFLKVL